ncbi:MULTISPECIES: amidase family protein [unclassified Streptomyces]|uniref:amidase family protein n=1 Tax=unclassified Streptomyces TaxID=2593676 RepID=UPI001CBE466C|nr:MULTISPECIES: amidase family protein [unclassified Streptomyces]WPO70457.1 amidase family protein [Streptomyces sp. KN37]
MSDTGAPTVVAATTAAGTGSSCLAVEQVHRSAEAHAQRELHDFTQVDVAAAVAEAEHIDGRAHERLLPLRGVVLAVKDNIDVMGFATTAGTEALRGHRPRADAPVVGALRAAGAVVLGKSNMHELAYGVTSDNAVFGRVSNPLAPDHLAGGSSGGSAAAVAAGVVSAALGTETGCSVRLPAAFCGLVGFRPTVGGYPVAGVVPVSWTRDTVGLLAHSVADVRILDAVLRPDSSTSVGVCQALRGLRLAAPHRPFQNGMSSFLRAAFQSRLTVLRRAGVEIVERELPVEVDEAMSACGLPIALYETPPAIDGYLAHHGLSYRFADVAAHIASPDVAGLLRPLAAVRMRDEQYERALVDRARLSRALRDFLTYCRVSGLIVPTAPVTAPRLLAGDRIAVGERRVPAFPLLVRNTDASSILGWPAITVPATQDEEGLPFGIDLQFPSGSDNALLAVAQACELLWREDR